jgi:enoyl-CoA hydratase
MEYKNLIIENKGGILYITINRPQQLNALNRETIAELSDALELANTAPSVRVIILRGAGDKAFVAGADIKEFAHFSVQEGKNLSADGHRNLFNKIEDLNKPVIAAVNGFALGGGLELAMAAHIRIASENAKMGLPEVSLGVIPGYGGTQRLSQLVGKGKALEMICTASAISAAEALEWGLVNQVTSQEDLLPACEKIASKIIQNSPLAVGAALRAVLAGYESSKSGFEAEIKEFGWCFGTGDFKEGTSAFMEKRKPEFQGK